MSNPSLFIKKIVSKDCHWKIDLLQKWQKIASTPQNKIRIEAILDQTLVLGVPHPAIAHQLSMASDVLLEKIHKLVPNNPLKKLTFRIVNFTERPKETKPKPQKNREIQLNIDSVIEGPNGLLKLNEKELKSLDSIYCKHLKQALWKFYTKCKHKEKMYAKSFQRQECSTSFVDNHYLNNLEFR